MKTNIQKIGAILLLFIVSLFTLSCNRNSVEETLPPTNEVEEKGHDEWAKVEIIIREGHLHGVKFHGNPESDMPILPKTQTITFEQIDGKIVRTIDKGNSLKKDIEAIEVASGYGRYSMEIIYYDNHGERINYQFLTPEQLNLHQHFFTISEYSTLKNNELFTAPKGEYFTNLHEYTYRDTNPEDQMLGQNGAVLLNNPVGLKGYFGFLKGGIRFNMEIKLVHYYISKFNANGNADPANNPALRRKSHTTDFLQKIPFVVIGHNAPLDNETEDEAVDRFHQEVADYYGITPEEVDDYIWESNADIESGSFWM